ncbi:hypothetical protein KAS50_08470, partial [bacterium]|nr:hypothetical protein [bacterium]
EGMIDFLISDDPAAVEARSKIDFKILPLINPDAHANKWYRFNAHGIDLNRNWDQGDLGHGHDSPVPEPEIAAVKTAVKKWMDKGKKRSIAIDIHDWEVAKCGIEFSPIGEKNIESPEIKLFYEVLREKYFPHTIFYYSKPKPGSFVATGANAPSYFNLNVPGNEISTTIEIGLGGWGPESNPAKIPAVPRNVKHFGEQLAKMCLEYFNSSE